MSWVKRGQRVGRRNDSSFVGVIRGSPRGGGEDGNRRVDVDWSKGFATTEDIADIYPLRSEEGYDGSMGPSLSSPKFYQRGVAEASGASAKGVGEYCRICRGPHVYKHGRA